MGAAALEQSQPLMWPQPDALDAEVIAAVAATTWTEQALGLESTQPSHPCCRGPVPTPTLAVQVRESTDSTMADALHAAQQLPPDLASEGALPLVLAEHQRAGKGRRDRAWSTPTGSGLALSLVLPLRAVPTNRWGWLPLMTAVAVCQATSRLSGLQLSIKWPNDVLIGCRKVAGILVEHARVQAGRLAVVGIGLNVGMAAADLPVPTATSLCVAGAPPVQRSVLAGRIVGELLAWHHRWVAVAGQAQACDLAQEYLRRSATVGQEVVVQLPQGKQMQGHCVGVARSGQLQVRCQPAGGVRNVAAADVVHLRPVAACAVAS